MSEEQTNIPEDIQEEAPQYTEKELAAMRDKMTKFYKDELKHLQPQAQYFKALADIAENKYRADAYKAKHSELFVQQAQQEAEYKAQKEWYDTELAAGRIKPDGTPVEGAYPDPEEQGLTNSEPPQGTDKKQPRKLQGQ